MNGASFGEALGYGAISGFAAFAGGQFGSALGGALGLGKFATGVLAGMAGGAAGGATGAALMGGDVTRATFAGMAGGTIGASLPIAGPILGGGVAAEIAGGEFWHGAAGGAAYMMAAAITNGALQAASDVGQRAGKVEGKSNAQREIAANTVKPKMSANTFKQMEELANAIKAKQGLHTQIKSGLQWSQKVFGVAALGAAFAGPPGQAAALVFTGLTLLARGLEVTFYSKTQYQDVAVEGVKMSVGSAVGSPWDYLTDEILDTVSDYGRNKME